uniref:Distal membrane-arm assembly complex protein 1-like domain-containing protein n=1 Tax=Anopheles minimus TaxID=112268 RepID=A0A182VQT1_9DIPT
MSDSVISNRHKDCLPCRLISGFGVIGMGVYIALHGQKRPTKLGRYSMFGVATVAGGVGLARLLDVYPFGERSQK